MFTQGEPVLRWLASCGLPAMVPGSGAAPLATLALRIDTGQGMAELSIGLAGAPAAAAEGVDLGYGPWPYQIRRLGQQANLQAAAPALSVAVSSFWSAFVRLQCLSLEATLARAGDGALQAVAAAAELDLRVGPSNPAVKELLSTLDPSSTLRLKALGIDYVTIPGGAIGVLSVGAGETMAVIDLIARCGQQATAFCDISGGITAPAIVAALQEITGSGARSLLVNIFGGVTRVDRVAELLVAALAQHPVPQPTVIRLEGNGAEAGRATLRAAGYAAADSLQAAVAQVVELAEEGQR